MYKTYINNRNTDRLRVSYYIFSVTYQSVINRNPYKIDTKRQNIIDMKNMTYNQNII